jgi:hypothetical protein
MRVGRVCQAAVRRAAGGAGLPVALHTPGDDLQQPPARGTGGRARRDFRWKDYRASKAARGQTRHKATTLTPEELMRRLLLHVLPSGFHRVRPCGLLAIGNREKRMAKVRVLLVPTVQSQAPTQADNNDADAASSSRPPPFVCRHRPALDDPAEPGARGIHPRPTTMRWRATSIELRLVQVSTSIARLARWVRRHMARAACPAPNASRREHIKQSAYC